MIPCQEQDYAAHISTPILRIPRDAQPTPVDDDVVVEEPLEIRVEEQTLTITMRTPGDDRALAMGFLRSEGIISSRDDVLSVRHCERNANLLRISLSPGVPFDSTELRRNFLASSSCGICGAALLDQVRASQRLETAPKFALELLASLPARLKSGQSLFQRTGGAHAAGLFDAEGRLVFCKEDIGRHNAVDKAVGECVQTHGDLSQLALCTSGRASFEILQKAIAAGISAVVAVGAPSSLAVKLARDFGVTLIGFAGDKYCNVYADNMRQIGPSVVPRSGSR